MSETLPSELWLEILVRLPVRSLLTLKCVSKSFLSIIENPKFPSLHFTHFNSNLPTPKGYHLTFSEFPESNASHFLIHRRDYETDPLDQIAFWGFGEDVIDYVNGLLLMSRVEENLVIFSNPTIRKSLTIPLPCDYNGVLPKLGFGYDPLSDDYKVVAIEPTELSAVVEVYSLRSRSWRRIDVGVDSIVGSCLLKDHVFVNGAIHWTAGEREDDEEYLDIFCGITHIISFDLSTEVFSFTMLPDLDRLKRVKFPLLYDGSFALISFSSTNVCVWVMRGNDCRTKEYDAEIHSQFFNLLLDKIDDITNVIFSEKTREIMLSICWEGLLLYNTETKHMWNYEYHHYAAYVVTYMESLFWFPQK